MRIHQGLLIAGLLAAVSLAAGPADPQSRRHRQRRKHHRTTDDAGRSRGTVKLDANRPQPQAAYDRARLEVLWRALNSLIEDKLITAGSGEEPNDPRGTPPRRSRKQRGNALSRKRSSSSTKQTRPQIPIPRPGTSAGTAVHDRSSRRRYRDMLVTNMRRNFKVTTFLDPFRTDVATAGYPSRGPANAPVTIVEFADFECPFCGAFYPTLKLVEKNYADRVRLVYRQFPLTNIHPNAQKAAEASLCANEQRRFWEFHDSLFSDQSRLDVPSLKQRAQTLGLNTAAFNTCLDSGRQAEAIQKDKDDARKAGREQHADGVHQWPLAGRKVLRRSSGDHRRRTATRGS